MAVELLSLDPSSTRTGYAMFSVGERVVEAGYLRPRRVKDDVETRIDAMCEDLALLCERHAPQRAVIEVPSGKVGGGQRRGAGASLAIYGLAVGELRRLLKESLPALQRGTWARPLVCSVTEREWTGRRSKALRQRVIAAQYPDYAAAMASDGGGDVSDAIGVGLWWIRHRAEKVQG